MVRSTHTGILLYSCEGVPPLIQRRVSPVGWVGWDFLACGVGALLYRVRVRYDCSRVRPLILSASPPWPHSLRSLVLRAAFSPLSSLLLAGVCYRARLPALAPSALAFLAFLPACFTS